MKKLLTILLLILGGRLSAHPMPASMVELSVFETAIKGTAKIPLPELANAVGDRHAENISDPFLLAYFKQHIQAHSVGGNWNTIINNISLANDTDEMIGNYQEVVVAFTLIPPAINQLRKFTFNYDAVIHQVVTHSALIAIKQDWNNGLHAEGHEQELGLIRLDVRSGNIYPLEVNLAAGSSWKGFTSMISLGMEHIRTGTDHLLFLLMLLLPSMLIARNKKWDAYMGTKKSLIRLTKIVTAFTIGHSITLLAGSAGWLRLPSQPVEILIAVSILVSAIHGIRPVFPGREGFVAAGFGLVHGLAFATVLSNLDIGVSRLALSILGFNLGIEIMQIFVIILIVPWLIMLSRRRVYKWFRIAGALLSGTAALAWILQRFTGNENFITTGIETLANGSIWMLIALAAFATVSLVWPSPATHLPPGQLLTSFPETGKRRKIS